MEATPFSAIPLDTVKGVLIDLDNTLYEYEPAHQAGLKAAYDALPFEQNFDVFANEYRAARTVVTRDISPHGSCRSRILAFQALAERWSVENRYSLALELETTYWTTFITHMAPHLEALAFLKKCQDQKVPVCIVSDMTTSIQIQKIQKLGVEKLITYLVTSEEIGVEKPNVRIFKAGLRKLDLKEEDVIMIGDHEDKDVKGALDMGIKAFHIQLN